MTPSLGAMRDRLVRCWRASTQLLVPRWMLCALTGGSLAGLLVVGVLELTASRAIPEDSLFAVVVVVGLLLFLSLADVVLGPYSDDRER